MTPVRLVPLVPQAQVKHSTTEPLGSLTYAYWPAAVLRNPARFFILSFALVQPRKTEKLPDMTEKLLMGTKSFTQTNKHFITRRTVTNFHIYALVSLKNASQLFPYSAIFHAFLYTAVFFSKSTFKKKSFQENYQSVKQFGSRSGLTFCPA